MDRCINPVEAAGFRATMKTLALGLKEAVKKGRNIDTTYEDLIKSTIEVARAMRYPGAFSVEVEEILAAIPDIHCNAWKKHLKGEEMMDPKDVVMDDEEEENDLLIGCSLLLLSTRFLGQDQHLQLSWTLHRPAPDPLLRPIDGRYGQKGWYP